METTKKRDRTPKWTDFCQKCGKHLDFDRKRKWCIECGIEVDDERKKRYQQNFYNTHKEECYMFGIGYRGYIVLKSCGQCYELFVPDYPNEVYCSDECRKERHRIANRQYEYEHIIKLQELHKKPEPIPDGNRVPYIRAIASYYVRKLQTRDDI